MFYLPDNEIKKSEIPCIGGNHALLVEVQIYVTTLESNLAMHIKDHKNLYLCFDQAYCPKERTQAWVRNLAIIHSLVSSL